MKDLFNLEDKNVIIFGGLGILGAEISKSLISYNATLISCDLKKVSSEDQDSNIDYYSFDIGDEDDLLKFRDEVIDKYQKIDVIINCLTSKYDDFYLPFDQVSTKGWEIGLKGNLTIPFMTCKAFISHFVKNNGGSIINISSVYGLVGNDQSMYEGSNLHEIYVENSPDIKQIYSHGVYNAAKGGLNNFTRYLAAYYGKNNIRVNTISPGGVAYPAENEIFVKKYSAKTPLGRKARKDEMNGAVIFLASNASSYVTGHNLVVDGGFTCW